MKNMLIILITLLGFASPAFANAYLCSDGFFRGEQVIGLECKLVTAVVNREPAEPYIPSIIPARMIATFSTPGSRVTTQSEPLLDYVQKKEHLPPFQMIPELVEKYLTSGTSGEGARDYTERVFRGIPHPKNIFDCINSVLQSGASPSTCSKLILQKYRSG